MQYGLILAFMVNYYFNFSFTYVKITNDMKQPFFISITEWQEQFVTYKTFNLNLSMCGLFIVS
jgi:hypothetical protein